MDAFAYMDAASDAASVEDLWALHCAQMARYGFDRLLYGLTHFRNADYLGDPREWIILSSHPEEYTRHFIDDGLFLEAPLFRWTLDHDGACAWDQLALQQPAAPAERQRIAALNRRFRVFAGYTISFRAMSLRTKGAIMLTARSGLDQKAVDAVWADHGREIIGLNNFFHLKLLTLPANQRPLTQRQREVLEWVGDGKTTQDIAVILGLTPATVEKHLRLAREALEAETTAHAVFKAAVYNQIFGPRP